MIAFITLDTWTCPYLKSRSLLVDRLEDALAVNVKEDAYSEEVRHQIGTAIADEWKRQALVRQERGSDSYINGSLETEQRNDPASDEESETILGVERNHHSTNNDDDEEKDHEEADPQA